MPYPAAARCLARAAPTRGTGARPRFCRDAPAVSRAIRVRRSCDRRPAFSQQPQRSLCHLHRPGAVPQRMAQDAELQPPFWPVSGRGSAKSTDAFTVAFVPAAVFRASAWPAASSLWSRTGRPRRLDALERQHGSRGRQAARHSRHRSAFIALPRRVPRGLRRHRPDQGLNARECRSSDAYNTLQTFLGGLYVNDFNEFGQHLAGAAAGRARVPRPALFHRALLRPPNSGGDTWCRLSTLATITPSGGPDVIYRYNRFRAIRASGHSRAGVNSRRARQAPPWNRWRKPCRSA